MLELIWGNPIVYLAVLVTGVALVGGLARLVIAGFDCADRRKEREES